MKPSLFIIFTVIIFAPIIEGGTTHLPIFILRILLVALLAVNLIQWYKDGSVSLRSTALDPAVGLFVAASVIAYAAAPYKHAALTWVQLFANYIVFFYLARRAMQEERAPLQGISIIFCIAGFEAVLCLFQIFSQGGRVTGTFFNPNMLAGFVAPALLVALSFIIYKHPWARGRAKVLFFAFCAAAFFAIVMTGSRGGALSFAVGLFVLVWIRSKKVALITAALLLALLALIQNPIKERVINTEPYSYSRVDIWKSAGRMLLDHPQGVGLGNFKFYWTEYNFPVDGAIVRYGKKAATAHGEYQHFGAEMGFLGIAAILFGLFLLLRACRNSIKVSVSRGDPAAAAGVSAGIITVLVHAAVDANLHEPGIVFLFIMLVVIMLQAGEDGRDIRADLGQSRPMFAAASLGWVFLMLVWAAVPAIGYYCGTKADAAMKAGNAGEAVKFLDIAQRVEPGNAEIYNRRAALYFRQSAGDPKAFEKAVTELGKAAKCNPVERSYPAISAQIELSAASGKASPDRQLLLSALKDSEYASRLDPFGWDIMLNRARVLVLLGDTDNAIKALERLKSVEPDCLEGRRLLAVLYKKTGQKDLSAEECRIIIESFEKYSKGAVMPQERQFLSVDISAVRALSAELKKG